MKVSLSVSKFILKYNESTVSLIDEIYNIEIIDNWKETLVRKINKFLLIVNGFQYYHSNLDYVELVIRDRRRHTLYSSKFSLGPKMKSFSSIKILVLLNIDLKELKIKDDIKRTNLFMIPFNEIVRRKVRYAFRREFGSLEIKYVDNKYHSLIKTIYVLRQPNLLSTIPIIMKCLNLMYDNRFKTESGCYEISD